MAAYDAKYFQAIYNSVDQFWRDKKTTVTSVKIETDSYAIFKYYDLRVLQSFCRSLSGYDLNNPSQFDTLINALYNFKKNPGLEPPDLKALRDYKNQEFFLNQQLIKERQEISKLPLPAQAQAVKQWAQPIVSKNEQRYKSTLKQSLSNRSLEYAVSGKAGGLGLGTAATNKPIYTKTPVTNKTISTQTTTRTITSTRSSRGVTGIRPRGTTQQTQTEASVTTGITTQGGSAPGGILKSVLSNPVLSGVAGGLGDLVIGKGGRGANFVANTKDRLNNLRNRNRPIVKAGQRFLLILLVIIILFILFQLLLPQDNNNQLEIFKSGDTSVSNGQDINYTIRVTYTGTGSANVEVTDPLPKNTEFVGASDGGVLDLEAKKVRWNLSSITSNQPKIIRLTIKPVEGVENIWVTNQAEAIITGRSETATNVTNPGGVIDIKSGNLNQIFTSAAQYANIPLALLKAIGKTESAVLSYTDEEIIKFSIPGWWEGLPDNHPDIRRGYAYNTCADPSAGCGAGNDVRGAMQFELGTWNGIKQYLQFADGHDPDRRILTDIIFGSAMLNRKNAESYTGVKDISWTEDVVRAVARMYCAGPGAGKNPGLVNNTACRRGNLLYDDLVWEDFQKYSQ